MPSQATENYLKAIYKLAQQSGVVTTSDLVRGMKVRAASASNMMKKLAESGYVSHHPYRGVRLTKTGQNEALRIIRNHRILECFLVQFLNYSSDEVDEEAELLEHVLSERAINRMEELLKFPKNDPHGSPIPDRNLNYRK